MFLSKKKKHDPQYSTWCIWHDLLDSCNFPASHTQVADYHSESEWSPNHEGWLECGAPFAHIGSWEEGMSYRINKAPSSTYIGNREKGMLFRIQIAWMSNLTQVVLLLR